MKKLSFILLFFVLLLLVVPVSAAERAADFADILTYEEEVALCEKLDQISEAWECDIVVLTLESLEGKTAQAYADDYYDENGFGYGDDWTGILFLVSMGEREWAFSTCGDAIRMFTDAGLVRLEDAVIGYLSDGYYYDAFSAFADECADILERAALGEIFDDYGGYIGYEDYYYEEEVVFDPVSWIPLSIIIGFIISLIVVNVMKGEMNSVHPASGASQFEKQGSFRVTSRQDIYLYRNISKTPRQTEQSRPGGAGSSVHRSSSGRSHGGRSGIF